MPRDGQRVGIHLHAHGVLLRAEHLHARHAADHGDALREQRVGVLVDRVQRQRGGVEREIEDRLLGRIHLLIRRRARHAGRQPAAGACEMAACISCAAASILRSSANWTVIDVMPCEFVELIDSMPAMVENSRSSGVATEDAMVSGFAPGRPALTWMVG